MKNLAACLMLAFTLVGAAPAQDKAATTYRLHFRFRESGPGTKETTKDYFLAVQTKSRGKINASRRVPYYTSSKGEAKELHTAALGSIIECMPDDSAAGLRLDCAFESSYVVPGQPAQQTLAGFLPLINSRQVSTVAVIPVGTEVQVALLDDPASGNRLEILVSAERLSNASKP
jgi:hypothetical protein